MKYLALLVFSLSLSATECRLSIVEWTSASIHINPDLADPDKLITKHTSFGCVIESANSVAIIH
jgi:hypothetical protein